jgi:hypothetical protein
LPCVVTFPALALPFVALSVRSPAEFTSAALILRAALAFVVPPAFSAPPMPMSRAACSVTLPSAVTGPVNVTSPSPALPLASTLRLPLTA